MVNLLRYIKNYIRTGVYNPRYKIGDRVIVKPYTGVFKVIGFNHKYNTYLVKLGGLLISGLYGHEMEPV